MEKINFEAFGFEPEYKTDSLSNYSYYTYTKKEINVAYVIEEALQKDNVYSIYVGSLIDYVRNMVPGKLIFRGTIDNDSELETLLRQVGVKEYKKNESNN